ncbi:hypothetical protein ACFVMC_15020 [Nocardia sp. NPDC127579]|uniref:hypothetical protein n=1 Tax=Nocardia sp. NPDC127579 TaxID=3345402 RepID=UPI00363551B1
MGIRDKVTGLGSAVGQRAGNAVAAGMVAVGNARERAVEREWARRALDNLPEPQAPTPEVWEHSLGSLIKAGFENTPKPVGKVLDGLISLGGIRFGPETVGFDGQDIPWEKVVEIRCHNAFLKMTTSSLEQEVDKIRDLLPPVPGRKWALTKIGEGLSTVLLASMEQADPATMVATEIVYTGMLGRTKTLDAGMYATSILAQKPAVQHSLIATAQALGVTVVTVDPGPQAQRIQARVRALRDRAAAVTARLEIVEAEPEHPVG